MIINQGRPPASEFGVWFGLSLHLLGNKHAKARSLDFHWMSLNSTTIWNIRSCCLSVLCVMCGPQEDKQSRPWLRRQKHGVWLPKFGSLVKTTVSVSDFLVTRPMFRCLETHSGQNFFLAPWPWLGTPINPHRLVAERQQQTTSTATHTPTHTQQDNTSHEYDK